MAKARKIELLLHADDVARSEGASISQVQVALGDSTRHFVVANSDGLFAADHQVRTRFNVSCVATGDGGMQTGYRPIAGTRGFEILTPDAVADAARGAARANFPWSWRAARAESCSTRPAVTDSRRTPS